MAGNEDDMMDDYDYESQPSISHQFIKDAGEANGLHNIGEDASKLIGQEVSFRLKEVIEIAKKYRTNGRRRKLTAEDFSRALKMKSVEPVYGYCNGGNPIGFQIVKSAGGKEYYVQEDKEIDLNTILAQPPPKAPLQTTVKAHWLAVNGVQPAVPENPVDTVGTGGIHDPHGHRTGKGGGRGGGPSGSNVGDGGILKESEIIMAKQVTNHDLSMEQQIYLKEVCEACVGSDEMRRTEALNSLQKDTGLQPLLPRLVIFISEGVRCNLVQHNLALLIYLMRMVRSLVHNNAINLQKGLHELIPCVLSCVVSRVLCARPDQDNHWALRDFAAKLLANIVERYEKGMSGLSTRIAELLARPLNSSNSFPILYGSVNAIGELGHDTVKSFLINKVPYISSKMEETMNSPGFKQKPDLEYFQRLITKVLMQNYVKPMGLKEQPQFKQAFGTYLGDTLFNQYINTRSSQQARQQTGSAQQASVRM